MKIISKILISVFVILIILVTYLSTIGIETNKFNNQIESKISKIDKKIEVELKKIRLVLDPFKLKVDIKTIGAKVKNRKGIIEIESLKTQISLKSFIRDKFSIQNLEISTKSLEVNNLISFIRYFQNTPELFILEKAVKKGFLIADIKFEFDTNGKIKDNYQIDGFVRDAKLSILEKYNPQKIDFLFRYTKDNLLLNDISLSINDQNFLSENIKLKKNKDDIFVNGKINHKKISFDEKNLNLFIKPFFPKINFKKLRFSSNNNFSFKLNKKLRFYDFVIESNLSLDELSILNELKLKNFFPNLKKNVDFLNHELSIKYLDDKMHINGKGNILIQDKKDIIEYSLSRINDILSFKTSLKIDNNPFKIKTLNYEKMEGLLKLEGSKNKKNEIYVKEFSVNEKKNQIKIENLTLNKKFEIIGLGKFYLNYTDKENQKNQIKFYKSKEDKYILKGSSFNANSMIDDLISDDKKSNLFNINSKINIDIDKIYLDKEYELSNFIGDIFFKKKKILKANLVGNFKNNKRLEFTIDTKNNNKTTTLFMDYAEPMVKRYKFIKGFDKGILDFYSSKTNNVSTSTLKIYDFKLKELPVLTKILTLASLQGISDILSGEGIRFDDFEMNFKNEGTTMTIGEIYAIGPAISILMDGYIEKNKTISLRGTLVPATTINKFIGSIPVVGKLLVGTKTGEGVFGVSFKIKGPPKNLETTVNPIKTLTPRFITRTLENIKKN